MKKLIILTLIVFTANWQVNGQKTKVSSDCITLDILDGYFIKHHTYALHIDTARSVHITFNNKVLPVQHVLGHEGVYYINSEYDGTLRIFQISQSSDTTLATERRLKFKDPNYRATFSYKRPGSTINDTDLRNGIISVDIPNNDMDERAELLYVNLIYYANNSKKSHVIYQKGITDTNDENWRFIPVQIFEEISSTNNGVLIFDVSIRQGDVPFALPPMVYFYE